MNDQTSWTTVLFDVDGTIVDSAPAVTSCFRHALKELGLPDQTEDELRRYVGPPLWNSFQDLGLEGDALVDAIESYRRNYHDVYLDPQPFTGMRELIEDLHEAGVTLATATSKQEYQAEEQLNYLGMSQFFTAIVGATPDPDCTKASVIRDALTRLQHLGVDTSRAVLVGDRCWDVEGGHAEGIPVIGALWGYAEEGELAGAYAIAESVEEARSFLL